MHCQYKPDDDTLEAATVLSYSQPESFAPPQYIYKPQTGSTNDDARALAADGAPHGTLVVADAQSAGRGRQARTWVSPPGSGIYVSLLLYPNRPLSEVPLLGIVAAVAAVQAIQKTSGAAAQIKWPNDILLNSKKIAGILSETELHPHGNYAAIIGLGINVNTPRAALPARPQFPASSLMEALGHEIARAPLLAAWLDAMHTLYQSWTTNQPDAILAAWRSAAYGLGKTVTIQQHHTTHTGTLQGIAPDGALLLTTPNGKTHAIHAGDFLPITPL